MKRMRILGLALVAVFALAAVMAAGASAAKPTWKVCVKAEPKNTGEFSNKECTTSAGGTGKYNLVAGIGKGKPFKGKGGKAVLHNVIPEKGDIKVECESFKDSGEVVAPSGVVNVHAEFKKCKSLGFPCKTEGGKKETITTDPGGLAGELGWLNKGAGVAGESLTDQTAPGTGYQAQFECEGEAKVRVHGAVIGTIAPVGVVQKESINTFSVAEYGIGQTNSLSNPPAFEEGVVGVLLTELNGKETGNTWQPEGGLVSGQESTAINKGEALGIS